MERFPRHPKLDRSPLFEIARVLVRLEKQGKQSLNETFFILRSGPRSRSRPRDIAAACR
jgi:hypothetical protein